MKSYQQHCGLARALDVVGGRWTLLIVRELLLGPRRYSELLENLHGMTTNLLASRLKAMRDDGLIEKSEQAYRLTDRGRELEAVVLALGAWGQPLLSTRKKGHRRNVDWAMVSLKRRYDRSLNCCVEIRVENKLYTLNCCPEKLDVTIGRAAAPELLVTLTEEEFFSFFILRNSTSEPTVLGDADLWKKFREAFAV